MREYKINVRNEDLEFNFYSDDVDLHVYDAIIFNRVTFFLSQKMNENQFKTFKVGQVVNPSESN
ncbi:hypothetical protein [Paenibacillus polymyxa]|uniref:Uncharacterized protein n=1 Tax=Paenibacillus polymyxa (strain SC2) TaxID=886882 RepID=E3EJT4_PAEPS|nr:hypothetical protein [Paenibacillus polymyxa]ADO59682.1 hypothetical protein PPSC2_26705 [Paenibacillus polymyxa SC2]WPQ59492.1 hypothetical protein SKN87_27910 [Paenibacillus polymyxa]